MEFSKDWCRFSIFDQQSSPEESAFNKQLHKRLFRCNLFVYVSYSRLFDFSCLFHKTDQFYVLRLYAVVC